MLLNFTAYSDEAKVGQYVDASSITRKPGQTMAIFQLPSLVLPKFVYNGSIYTVAEDSKGDVYFDVSINTKLPEPNLHPTESIKNNNAV